LSAPARYDAAVTTTMRLVWTRGGRWSDVRATLAGLPRGSQVIVGAGELAHPQAEGAERSVGLPRGQVADWRFAPGEDCTGLHVHEMEGGTWAAHLDAVHPACGVVRHLRADAPQVLVGAGVGLGVLGGVMFGRSLGAALVGGLVGLVVAECGSIEG
jgi:hypothetical protein